MKRWLFLFLISFLAPALSEAAIQGPMEIWLADEVGITNLTSTDRILSDDAGWTDGQMSMLSQNEWVEGQMSMLSQNEPAAGQETLAEEQESGTDLRHLRQMISFHKIFLSLFVLFLVWFLNRIVSTLFDRLAERFVQNRLFIKRLTPVFRIFFWIIGLYIVIAGIIAPPIETVIAISASIGIAVGFASQDILKNIFGGIMIILDRPFQVGDKIQVGEHYGEVKSIGLRSSQIETPDDSMVSIPNGELMNRAVSNANSSALDCQVVTEIYFPATVDIMRVKDIARRAVFSSPYLYLNKPVEIISLNEIHNRYFVVKFRVKAYVLDIRYEFLFKSDVTEMIIAECMKLGIIPDRSQIMDDIVR